MHIVPGIWLLQFAIEHIALSVGISPKPIHLTINSHESKTRWAPRFFLLYGAHTICRSWICLLFNRHFVCKLLRCKVHLKIAHMPLVFLYAIFTTIHVVFSLVSGCCAFVLNCNYVACVSRELVFLLSQNAIEKIEKINTNKQNSKTSTREKHKRNDYILKKKIKTCRFVRRSANDMCKMKNPPAFAIETAICTHARTIHSFGLFI